MGISGTRRWHVATATLNGGEMVTGEDGDEKNSTAWVCESARISLKSSSCAADSRCRDAFAMSDDRHQCQAGDETRP